MWPNPQETTDLVTFTEEILNGKLHFLCSWFWRPVHWIGAPERIFYAYLKRTNLLEFFSLFSKINIREIGQNLQIAKICACRKSQLFKNFRSWQKFDSLLEFANHLACHTILNLICAEYLFILISYSQPIFCFVFLNHRNWNFVLQIPNI